MGWKLATKVATGGFGMVFAVVIILFPTMCLTKMVVAKIVIRKEILKK